MRVRGLIHAHPPHGQIGPLTMARENVLAFLPHRQIRKLSLTESAGGVVGGRRSMQTVPVKEWENSAVDCLDIVADASK